jgi:hypothetical protein
MPAPLAAIAGGLIKGALVGAKVGAKVAVKSSLKMGGSIARVGVRSGGAIVKRGGMVVKKSRVTMKKVKTNTAKSKKIDKDKFMKDKKRRAKEAEERRRKEREKLLEGNKDSNEKPNPEMKLKKPGGILGKIIDFLSTILIGWLVNTGLKLVNFIKKVIESIQNIGQSIKDFFTGIGDFFKKIGGAISSAFNTIKSFDISKIGNFIREKFDGIKNAFGNILKKIKGGLGLLKKKEQEDPKKIAKDGKLEEGKPQKPEEPTDVKGIKGTLDKVGSEISKGKETFDVAIDKAKKEIAKVGTEGTGVSTPTEQKIPTEKKEKVIDIKSGSAPKTPMKLKDEKDVPELSGSSDSIKSTIGTISFDGKTYPMGSSGLGGYIPGAGKGGSTYGKTSSVMKSESIKSVTPDNQSVSNLTPNKKKQKIVVIDQDQSMASSTPSASTKILMLKNDSVNTMIEQQFLSNLAYT